MKFIVLDSFISLLFTFLLFMKERTGALMKIQVPVFLRGEKMTIDLLNTTDRTTKISKTVTTIQSGITGEMRHSFNELSPVFELSITPSSLSGANYLYCHDTGKYYFITKTYPNKSFMIVECHEDVLMSYASQILSLNCIVSRSSKLWNLYLQDSSRQTQQNQNTYIKEFPNALDDLSFVMITSGSYQNVTP